MRNEYPQAQAAVRADVKERTFRLLVDSGLVTATPETEHFGRGVQKSFSINSIAIARIFGDMVKLGMTTKELSGLAEWLREHEGDFTVALAEPVFLRLAERRAGFWAGDFERAVPMPGKTAPLYVSVTEPDNKDRNQTAIRLLAYNLHAILQMASKDEIAWVKSNFKPSFVIAPANRENVGRMLSGTPPDDVDELIALAELSAAAGNKWKS